MPAKILVVDDDPNVQRLLTYTLRQEGYDVVTAADGAEAVERFHRILLSAGVMLIENVVNLDQLPVAGFEMMALPIKFFEGDGAPCRAVAILDD